ncbi:MAG TPA: hypothetical protein VFQ86_00685, partial [Arachidicoccus soli]|nr:hypothetical protein [Arachidicoccus soli]
DMARSAAIGRDLFVESNTSVASYYWAMLDNGAGPFPHHAWWQVGWISDYLMAEAELRSNNKIAFPRGFVTPKVGPHKSLGFAPGKIYNKTGELIIRNGLVTCSSPNVEYVTAYNDQTNSLFLIVMNDINKPISTQISLDFTKFDKNKAYKINKISDLISGKVIKTKVLTKVDLMSYGLSVYEIILK